MPYFLHPKSSKFGNTLFLTVGCLSREARLMRPASRARETAPCPFTARRGHAPTGIAMLKRAAQGAGAAGLAYAGYSFLKKPEEIDFAGESTAGTRAKIKRFNSLVNRGDNPSAMKTRAEQVKALKSGEQFDVIIIGGGCTGAGAALDATTRGLKTACTEPLTPYLPLALALGLAPAVTVAVTLALIRLALSAATSRTRPRAGVPSSSGAASSTCRSANPG